VNASLFRRASWCGEATRATIAWQEEIMPIQWKDNFDSALKDAHQEHKHVLLDFFNPL